MCLPDGKTRNSHFNELVGVEEAEVRRQGEDVAIGSHPLLLHQGATEHFRRLAATASIHTSNLISYPPRVSVKGKVRGTAAKS